MSESNPNDSIDARTEPPVILTNPGAEFADEARPGNMIIGMDRTPKGRLWACWTGTGDKQDTYFILATSDDGGDTWSKPRLVVGAPDPSGKRQRRALVGNLWTDPLGRLWLFFDQKVVGLPGPIIDWCMRCDDPDAASPVWNAPRPFAEGCTLNKPTVLSDGTWLLPVSDWDAKTARVFASRDRGETWSERGHVKFPGWEFDEHMIVERRDGRLWMLARTQGNPHESFSVDRGATWSEPMPSPIQNVNARFFLRRLASGRILLVKNGPTDRRLAERTHLSAFLSEDEGASWTGGLVLDARGAVSYPDGFQSPDGLIHILYDWNRHSDAEILLARFREEDILEGNVVSKEARLLQTISKATGPKPILYNGVELPLEWPPRRLDPGSAEPMPVPYLREKPHLIPIDVGRQLFVDDFLIESTTLTRAFHKAEKFEGNPVFKAETARELAASTFGEVGEQATVFTGQGGLFWDPKAGHFKLFYAAGWRGPLSLAISTDLVHWQRPELGLAGANHFLPEGIHFTGLKLRNGGSDNSVWLDLNAPASERIKFLTCWNHGTQDANPARVTHTLHLGDGKTWSEGIPTGKADDYCSFFYNPFRKKWCFSIKQWKTRGRCRYYSEHDDFLQGADWSKSVYWTNADRLDAPEPQGRYAGAGETPQLYSLNAVAYESLMVGMHYIHRGPKNELCEAGKYPKLLDLELGFSRDGFHWDRPDRSGFIAGSRTEGSWDRAYLHGAAGVFAILDEKLVFPYMGTSGIAPNGARGMYTGGAIGLASLRRDGFASMDAGPEGGVLTTRMLRFSGKHLFVNLDAANGSLRAELLSKDGSVLARSAALSTDSVKQRVTWENRSDLTEFAGKPVRLRFHLTRGELYSFWMSAEVDGASVGYLGAGGPGYGGVRDVARE